MDATNVKSNQMVKLVDALKNSATRMRELTVLRRKELLLRQRTVNF